MWRRVKDRGFFAAVLTACAALASCVGPPFEVEFGGCADVLGPAAQPICVLDPSDPHLRVWVSTETGTRTVIEAGARALSRPEPIHEGELWRLEILGSAPELVLRAGTIGRSARWSLPLRWQRSEPALDAIMEELGESSSPATRARARVQLEELLARNGGGSGRLRLLKLLAGLEAEVEPARAAGRLAELAQAFSRTGQIRSEVEVRTHHHLLLRGELEDARGAQEALDALPEAATGDTRSVLLATIFRAPWNMRLGRLRAALSELEDAETRAERLDDSYLLYIRQLKSRLTSRLGLYDETRETLTWLRSRAADLENLCRRADVLSDSGWSQLLMLEAGQAAAPVADLEAALALAVGCGSSLRSNIEVNLALAHLHAGHPERARAMLDFAIRERPEPPTWLREWRLLLEGRIALSLGRAAEALAFFRDLEQVSRETLRIETRWRAAIGEARSFEALARPDRALSAYARAENLLDNGALEAPLAGGQGPEQAFVFFGRGTRFYLDLLVRSGLSSEALEVARHSRLRALRRLARGARLEGLSGEAAAEWSQLQGRYGALRIEIQALVEEERRAAASELSAIAVRRGRLAALQEQILDEMLERLGTVEPGGLEGERRPLLRGELTLAFHPLPRGWVGFAADLEGLEMAEIVLPTEAGAADAAHREALSAALLTPFAGAIERAQRLRILPYGALWGVDFHALPFGDGVLLDRVPVAYGLDLPRGQSQGEPERGRALLVEDPTRSLIHAADEIRGVRRALEKRHWEVETLEASAARPETVWASWEGSHDPLTLFHFAGHGDILGGNRLDAGLVFSRGARLSLGDILARRPVPAMVVLSACGAVGSGRSVAPVGLGVGQALLLAGGRQVIGPTAVVDDASAAAVMRLFYAFWPDEPPAEALRRAQLTLRARQPGSQWASFRLLER